LDDADAISAIDRGFVAVADIHRLMSFHEADSDVGRLNRAGADRPVTVDPRTFAVLEQASRMAALSAGVFDITVAATLVAWGFLPRPESGVEPDAGASWRDIELIAPDTVRFHRPLWIDLGGIAKGYAVDQAVLAMALPPDIQCVVNAGGDLRVSGPAAERVLLRAPVEDQAVPVIEIENGSLASSSGREALRAVGDAMVGPHIDGTNLRGTGTRSFVSVAAPECMIADVLTKIILARGHAAADMLELHDATAYLHQDGAGWHIIGSQN
jgi:thiamine biosynthesis lipoprotein